ncbi:Lnb N-terminal periplasmic domain-containing protein [Defluviimonas salinarum]|uniref:DUF4105 domain-containing protein n=1 Tax=Defluviimonas salinarum TaxID=2992147 RepID=A0ABT3J409_9RHOB|nr:DUF4105 domain-containing protein [Defluviimonas salinarum]MCW3782432.1 DUF4105 domain-containing protein [Defluviimonas salinarum]
MKRTFRIFGVSVFAAVALLGAAWAATAFSVQLDGIARLAGWSALLGALIAAGLARIRSRRAGWAVLALAALGVGGWYQTITPRQDRDWDFDVRHGVRAEVTGDTVTLRDLRDFDWASENAAKERWTTASYDLDRLQSVDMLTSVWDSPDIAHLLVSFGFEDGEHVVFSVEIRREVGETFNEIGGFFRQFELVLIAATEEDIVKLRTNHRGEQVSLYPIELDAAQRRTLFMSYVALAQRLERDPAFYNTLTANCTTVVYQLAQAITPDLPMDWRLVMSGHLPDYVESLGVLGGEGSMEARRRAALITPRARVVEAGADFSAAIRLMRPGGN